ncbi:serine/threonine-protein kinase [Nocardiopsis suaedae]|uniref:Serine/threonine-protein kinase n=1 Tax=Nocardiopsis suaedae TaxID=3018444 RepID=A0ABT4TFR0_9ACTN|nr:serine/threonine-protein kinase [Nocardiopsis suaedae]MDA2803542.1 serine/threonine-protein kinase [Nocardiopsis suaedae]
METAQDRFAAAGVDPRTPNDPTDVGPFRIVGRLGAGGMGAVYAAVDASGAPLALKVVHREYAADTAFRARFTREVDLMRRVSGTCVPGFISAETSGERPWLGIEYIPGLTLSAHVKRNGPLQGDLLMGLAAGIAEGLQAVHGAGIVHRDLKPGNIILSPSGPKVLDFGIARAVEESAITRTGELYGTPGWLAPEQYRGAAPGTSSDMFAWGGLVAFAATGRRPFGTGSAEELAVRTLEASPDLDGVPEALLPVVTAALDKDPGRRPTAVQALQAVTGAWTGAAPAAEEATRVLPGLLQERWTEVHAPDADTTGWIDLTAPRRPAWRSAKVLVPAAAAMALVLGGTAGGAVWLASDRSAGGGGGGTGGGSDTGSGGGANGQAADGNGGGGDGGDGNGGDSGEGGDTGVSGPVGGADAAVPGGPDLGPVSGLDLQVPEPDTVELAVRRSGQAGPIPFLRLNYGTAERDGADLVVSGTAEYLADEGGYRILGGDYAVVDFNMQGDGPAYDADPRGWEGAWRPDPDAAVAEVTAEEPRQEFTLTVNDVPEADPAEYDGLRYLDLLLPEQVWGYTLQPAEDISRVCFQEGPTWNAEYEGPAFDPLLPCG